MSPLISTDLNENVDRYGITVADGEGAIIGHKENTEKRSAGSIHKSYKERWYLG